MALNSLVCADVLMCR